MTKHTAPVRRKRSESFLGVHFDFHADHDCIEVGKNVTRKMIADILDQVRPDYVQCDCKGHPGCSTKTVTQLQQEAAAALATGGGVHRNDSAGTKTQSNEAPAR